jgi:hypothetical protein
MANPNIPFGFQETGIAGGIAPNFGMYADGQISSSNPNSIYGWDVAKPISGGYFDVFTAAVGGGAPIGGIFVPNFSFPSKSQGGVYKNRAWLNQGSDVVAGGIVGCKIVNNPQSRFIVRSAGLSGTAVGQSAIGSNANFAIGPAPGNNLISAFWLDDSTIGAGVSLPFRIVGIVPNPPSDPTSIYNQVIVAFNNLAPL